MNRILCYAFLIFAVIGHANVWLIARALASVLTYSDTAAIYAIILAAVTANGLFDIDVLGV